MSHCNIFSLTQYINSGSSIFKPGGDHEVVSFLNLVNQLSDKPPNSHGSLLSRRWFTGRLSAATRRPHCVELSETTCSNGWSLKKASWKRIQTFTSILRFRVSYQVYTRIPFQSITAFPWCFHISQLIFVLQGAIGGLPESQGRPLKNSHDCRKCAGRHKAKIKHPRNQQPNWETFCSFRRF